MAHPLGLDSDGLTAYFARVFGSHDYRILADVLDLNEKVAGSVELLDGQVNLQRGEGVRRTGSFVLADPDGALNFDAESVWGGSMWADRMLRIRHVLDVPGYGLVTATPFVGPPSVLSRSGGEITVECQDKTALAVRGSRPLTVREGANAVAAIRRIMSECTGEFRFRFPSANRKRLTRDYSVGWDDEASPWTVCQKIARSIGMQLVYDGDGALVLRRLPSSPVATFTAQRSILELPDTSIDFTQAVNHVRVKGAKGVLATDSLPANHALAPSRLARRGVPRFLPLLIEEDSYAQQRDAEQRAASEARRASRLGEQIGVSVVPVFHLTSDDPVRLSTPDGDLTVPLAEASIPLGVGGPMTVGTQAWVSRPGRLRG